MTPADPTPIYYSAESLRLADDLGDRFRRLLKDEAFEITRRDGRTTVTADDIRSSLIGFQALLDAVREEMP